MNRRPLPPAAGLAMLYVALLQIGLALTLFLNSLVGLDMRALEVIVPAFGMLVSLGGQVAMGYAAATERSIAAGMGFWLVGCAMTVGGFVHLHDMPLVAIVIGVAQISCGPLVFALVARTAPDSRTPVRREIGALLIVIGAGGVIGSVWNAAWMIHLVGAPTVGLSITPMVSIVVAGFALHAARPMFDGNLIEASRRLVRWMWVAISIDVVLSLLTFISFARMARDLPRGMLVGPIVRGAFACVLPLIVNRLGQRALLTPVAPTDTGTVPTVYAWGALWFVPMLLCGALVARMTFISELASSASQLSYASAICGAGALLLLSSALTVLHATPVARYITQVAAAVSACALCYFVYVGLGTEARSVTMSVAAAVPVGMVGAFTVAMIALAWFEARRQPDLAPARVIS